MAPTSQPTSQRPLTGWRKRCEIRRESRKVERRSLGGWSGVRRFGVVDQGWTGGWTGGRVGAFAAVQKPTCTHARVRNFMPFGAHVLSSPRSGAFLGVLGRLGGPGRLLPLVWARNGLWRAGIGVLVGAVCSRCGWFWAVACRACCARGFLAFRPEGMFRDAPKANRV